MKIFFDFAVLVLIYLFILLKKWKTKGKDILLINTMLYIYLSFVMYFTLMPIITSLLFVFDHPYIPMNLVPFSDVMGGRGDFIRQIVLNIIMTIPFGFLLPFTQTKNCKLSKVVLYTFILSFCIELLQPFINGVRSSDITDIITNSFGGIIGYCLYILFKVPTLKLFSYIKKE